MTQAELIKAKKRWEAHCHHIQNNTFVPIDETREETEAFREKARKDYGFFVEKVFPHYAKCATAEFQIKAARKLKKEQNIKAGFIWPRGHAKSTHFDIFIPLWLMIQKPRQINVMVLVGKSEDSARTLLGDVQAELMHNNTFRHYFGEQKNFGSWADGQFVTNDNVAFFARGRGQSPRGLRHHEARPDYIVIDDLDDDELINNPKRVNDLTHWVKTALFGALDTGRGRFIMVGNLISKNSVLANIAASKDVWVSKINAMDKNGKPVWPEKWTIDEIERTKNFMGYRAFQKEFMNNPVTEGAIFKNEWIQWKRMLPLNRYDELVAYCDPSFKKSSKNDFKAIKLWGKKGSELHNIDAFVRQTSVNEMVRWFYDLHERLPQGAVCHYYIEANFLQDILLDEFYTEGLARGYQLPIKPDKRKKPDKFQRIEAISPLWERGVVYYNQAKKQDKDMQAGLEQTLAFEKGSRAHDDGPDADEGAINILQRHGRSRKFEPAFGNRPTPKNAW